MRCHSDWVALQWASDDLKGDREIVLKAVSQFWRALQWASDDLKGDREIVLKEAVPSQHWQALQWASDDLKGDREIVLSMLCHRHWRALSWASDDLKGDREIVLNAVSQDWQALQWASDDLKGDREVVLKAVSQHWRALQWASSELCEDQEIQELLSQTEFTDYGLLLKVSLLSGRCCTVFCHLHNTMPYLLRSISEKLGLNWQWVVENGKLVHQGEAELTGMMSALHELQPGKMHLLTLVL